MLDRHERRLEGGVVVERVRNEKPGHGLNAATGEYVDLFADGHHRPGTRDPCARSRTQLRSQRSS